MMIEKWLMVTLDMAIDAVEFPTCIPNTIDLDILIVSIQTIK